MNSSLSAEIIYMYGNCVNNGFEWIVVPTGPRQKRNSAILAAPLHPTERKFIFIQVPRWNLQGYDVLFPWNVSHSAGETRRRIELCVLLDNLTMTRKCQMTDALTFNAKYFSDTS